MEAESGFREKLLAVGSKVEREVLLLQRRWGSAMQIEASSPPTFTIQLHPSDPDFPHDIGDGLVLRFSLPEGYPEQQPCSVEVINENLTDEIRRAVSKGVQFQAKQMAGDLVVRDLLKWFDNSLTVLFECALHVAANPPAAPSHNKPAPNASQPKGEETAQDAAWTAEQQACLEKALKEFPATMETSERWKKIAEAVPGRSKKECVARFKELKQALQAGATAAGAEKQPAQKAAAAEGRESTEGENKEWTEEQQGALEAALREFPASEEREREERWRLIGGKVPGKSARECVERYQALKKAVKAQLEAAKREGAEREGAGEKSAKGKGGAKTRSFKFSIHPSPAPTAHAPLAAQGWQEEEEGSGGHAGRGGALAPDGQQHTLRLGAPPGEEEEEEDQDHDSAEEEGAEPGEGEEVGEAGEGEGGGGGGRIRALGMEGGAGGGVSMTGHHRGVQLRFGDLLLRGVGVAQLVTARVTVECTRCGLRTDAPLSRKHSIQGECVRCKQGQSAGWRADVVHAGRGCAGYLDLHSLAVVDLLPSTLWVSCEACATETPLRRMRRGRRVEGACGGCGGGLLAGFNDVSFLRVGPLAQQGGEAGRKKGGGGAGEKEGAVVAGQALPERGACAHYKRSLRWLRFPCCAKPFPCDICHQTLSPACEPGVWATRMICGLCSSEMPYSNKECKCGNAMGSSGAKTHWEGGKGCRNKTQMSNKDAKKFSNSKYKTVSRKAQRDANSK